VEKQRRLAHNLMPAKSQAASPVEVGAVWTTPNPTPDGKGATTARLHAGKFLVGPNGVVEPSSQKDQTAKVKPREPAPQVVAKKQTATVEGASPIGRESAKLNAMPALPAKPTSVKSQ
jgi:L-2-hydroxyglutarate oxidase LhgO